MKIPKQIKHKGKKWKIIFEANLEDDGVKCDGLCDSSTRTIYIEKNLTPSEQLAAFIHETFHVVIHEAHIVTDSRFSEEVEDIVAEAYTDMLTTTFKINGKSK